jgi:hypothetical protein
MFWKNFCSQPVNKNYMMLILCYLRKLIENILKKQKNIIFAPLKRRNGEMAERLNAAVLKTVDL